jgi:CDP-diacylglycerol--serine O-phosphatidyltransferase
MIPWIRRYIPSAVTLANLYLGVLAIALLLGGLFREASFLIVVGMFLDGVDGRLARLLDVTSSFGKELDSLADVITFGVAPAMLLLSFGWASIPNNLAAAAFVFCGAIRLARFNTQPPSGSGHFTGLPITAAGGIAATTMLYAYFLPDYTLPLIYLSLAALMVSRIPYPDFKSIALPRNSVVLVISIIGTIVLLWFAKAWVFVPLVFYALFGLGWHGTLWKRLPHAWRVRYEAGKARRLQRRLEKREKRRQKGARKGQT